MQILQDKLVLCWTEFRAVTDTDVFLGPQEVQITGSLCSPVASGPQCPSVRGIGTDSSAWTSEEALWINFHQALTSVSRNQVWIF
jgi:hypothetical protein